MGFYKIFRMFKVDPWIYVFLIACLVDSSLGKPSPPKPMNVTDWGEMGYDKGGIHKQDLAIGLGSGFAALFLLMVIAVIYLKKSRSSSSPKPDANNIYVVLPNGQTVQGQKTGTNVTVTSPNDVYALGGSLGSIGGAPVLPPRIIDSDDTYARIVESIYSTTPADRVLSIPMDDRKASSSTGSHYVSGFLGPSLLNPAYASYPSPSLLNVGYGDPRLLVEYRSHDGLSFGSSAGEEIGRSVSQSDPAGSEQPGSDESGNENNAKGAAAGRGQGIAPEIVDSQVKGAYGPLPSQLPGPVVFRPVLDRGQVSYVLDAETGYRSRVLPPENFIYVRDPESGYRTRVLAPPAPHVSYVYDPESGVRTRAAAAGAQGGGEGPSASTSQDEQPSSSASAAAVEQCHSGDSHDSQSSTASGASSSTPLASSSVPMDIRPSVPRFGYAAAHPAAAAEADVPTVIRRYNADTGEEYIYTLAVSRLPRTNVDR